MPNRLIPVVTAFLGFFASSVSALFASSDNKMPSEADRLKELLSQKDHNKRAVLLLPFPLQPNERFLWLMAHGSHVSHASHASHASHSSHVSGTVTPGPTTPVYTPPPLLTSDIPGFKPIRVSGIQGMPITLHLPIKSSGGQRIAYNISSFPGYGTVIIAASGSIEYTPQEGYVGEDTFSLVASNGTSSTMPVTFTVVVNQRKRWFLP